MNVYPYQMEAILRRDFQKGRPINSIHSSITELDRQMERQAEFIQRMRDARSPFNPTQRGSKTIN